MEHREQRSTCIVRTAVRNCLNDVFKEVKLQACYFTVRHYLSLTGTFLHISQSEENSTVLKYLLAGFQLLHVSRRTAAQSHTCSYHQCLVMMEPEVKHGNYSLYTI